MEEVELTAMGVATAPEVFNEVMERFERCEQHPQSAEAQEMGQRIKDGSAKPRKLSQLGQLQVVRAIGVAIVLEGSMHPTMELLLRHAIQYFGMKGKPLLSEPRNLDSVPRFLSDMAKLSPDEQLVVMCIHLLTMMLDGVMDDPVRNMPTHLHPIDTTNTSAEPPVPSRQCACTTRSSSCCTSWQISACFISFCLQSKNLS